MPTRNDAGILLDSPSPCDESRVLRWLLQGRKIWIIEPFHAYHHQGPIPYFPSPLPPFAEKLIEQKKVNLIGAKQLSAREIYPLAAEQAVATTEDLYPYYRPTIAPLIALITGHMEPEAEDAYKKMFCGQLAVFFSFNITLARVRRIIGSGPLMVHTSLDVERYTFFLEMLAKQSTVTTYQDGQIVFGKDKRWRRAVRGRLASGFIKGKILLQAIASLLLPTPPPKDRRSYPIAMAITSPQRQLRRNQQRGPEFLVDNRQIKTEDIVLMPVIPLSHTQCKSLQQMGVKVAGPKRPGHFFGDAGVWRQLALQALKTPWQEREALKAAALMLFTFGAWMHLLAETRPQHFITHADFGYAHMARGIAFKRHGVTSWYYTDASNFGMNFRTPKTHWHRHPFWTYLHYDHFVTWCDDLATFFKMHPGGLKHTEVVGCIWAQHVTGQSGDIDEAVMATKTIDASVKEKPFPRIVAFTSTYTVNGLTNYTEAIAFLHDLHRLIEAFPEVQLVVKEKKDRHLHFQVEPRLGRQLIEQLDKLATHQRIQVMTPEADTSRLMQDADLCISFPFTSTTFEALSAGFPALWHDPLELYRDVPYAVPKGVVTHGYDELKVWIQQHLEKGRLRWSNPIPKDSALIDPFRDGRAIDRFRKCLVGDSTP